MSMTDLAGLSGLGWDTIKRIVKSDMAKDVEKVDLKQVKFLAIDEVYLGKLHKFITVVIDWESGRVLYVAKGRGENALRPFFRRLRRAKARIQAVATDLSAAYAAAVIKNLPGAALVADRFHVIKLMNEKIDELRRALQREADIMGRRVIKGTRYLLLRGRENLSPDRIPDLEEALKLNKPLSQAYYLKEDLRAMWSFPDIEQMKRFFDDWCRRATETGVPLLASMAKTLRGFRSAILNGWIYPISNGKIEGINNKIGAMQRMHYGLRDFDFLSLRILTLHKAKHTFCG
jgi:transposase